MIRGVVIEGFKSYKEETKFYDFDKLNIILGKNGSGKSNLFSAFQFIFSNLYDNLSEDDKKHIIHQGDLNSKTVSASVEVLINEDSIKRVIDLSSDQFFINNKPVKKQHVDHFIENLGINRKNPYFIIKQGKINEMALLNDNDRFKLLCDVSGTTKFDQIMKKSRDIINENELKRQEVTRMIEDIKDRLHSLESERLEVEEYESILQIKNKIESVISQLKLNKLFNKRNQLLERKNKTIEKFNSLANNLEDFKNDKISFKLSLSKDNQNISLVQNKIKLLLNESLQPKPLLQVESFQEKTRLDDVEEVSIDQTTQKWNMEREYFEHEKIFVYDILEKLKDCNSKIEIANVFKENIDHYKSCLNEISKQLEENNLAIVAKRESLNQFNHNCDDNSNQKQIIKTKINHVNQQIRNVVSSRNQLMEKEMKKIEKVNYFEKLLEETRKEFIKMIPKSLYLGMESFEKLKKMFKFPSLGYFIDNIETDEAFYTIVDILADRYFFNVIVETDDIAGDILAKMKEQRLPGEISVIPLNKLKLIQPMENLEDFEKSNECVSVSSRILTNDARVNKIVDFVFNSTFICKDIDASCLISKNHKVNTITLTGDRIVRSGIFVGGYIKLSTSKIGTYKLLNNIQETLKNKKENHLKVQKQLNQLESELDILNSEKLFQETKWKELTMKNAGSAQENEFMSQNKHFIRKLEQNERYLNFKKDHFKKYILCMNNELERSNKNVPLQYFTKESIAILDEELSLFNEKMKNFIDQYICEERSKLDFTHISCGNGDKTVNLTVCEENTSIPYLKYLESYQAQLENHSNNRIKNESDLNKLKKNLKQFTAEKLKQSQLLDEMSMQLKTFDDKIKDIKDRFSLSQNDSVIDEYGHMNKDELMNLLIQKSNQLKKCNFLNKKSTDQYSVTKKQLEDIQNKKTDVDESFSALSGLLIILNEKRNNSLKLSLENISKEFKECFKLIVPDGKARLIIKNKGNDEIESVSMVACFNKEKGLTDKIKQFSGGQKTVLAFCLIFSIQKCHPSPFYILDEMDQALDSNYRQKIAELIYKQCNHAQFIISTFHHELLQYPSKIYGIMYEDKQSKIITLDSATDAIQYMEVNENM